jgi:histone deacetylase 1/2
MPIDDVLDDPGLDEDLIHSDSRRPRILLDSRRQADGELSDSDDEGEGGRRNHARHRDNDSTSGNESAGGRKFGVGMGIMSSGQTASTHHSGPSGHSTVARLLSAANAAMDADDTPSTSENGAGPPETNNAASSSDANMDDATCKGQ